MQITKKNKQLLIAATGLMIVLCAFVAGAATYGADDSSADSTVSYSYLTGEITVQQAGDANLFLYNLTSVSTVNIPANVTFTGTITFGYHFVAAGNNVDVVYDQLSFPGGISNVRITYDPMARAPVIEAMAADAAVNLTLVTGRIILGETGTLSGTVTAGAAVFTLAAAQGLEVKVADGQATFFGSLEKGRATVSGTATNHYLVIEAPAELVIADGATVTSASEAYMPCWNFDLTYVSASPEGLSDFYYSDTGAVATLDNDAHVLSIRGTTAGEYTLELMFAPLFASGSDPDMAGRYTDLYLRVVISEGSYYVVPELTVLTTAGTAVHQTRLGADVYSVAIATDDPSINEIYIFDVDGAFYHPLTVSFDRGILTAVFAATDLVGTSNVFYLQLSDGRNTVVISLTIKPVSTVTGGTTVYGDGTYTVKTSDSTPAVTAGAAGRAAFSFAVMLMNSATNRSGYIFSDIQESKLIQVTDASDTSAYFVGIEPGTYALAFVIEESQLGAPAGAVGVPAPVYQVACGQVVVTKNTATVTSFTPAVSAVIAGGSYVYSVAGGAVGPFSATGLRVFIGSHEMDYATQKVTATAADTSLRVVNQMGHSVYTATLTVPSADGPVVVTPDIGFMSGVFSNLAPGVIIVNGTLNVAGTLNVLFDGQYNEVVVDTHGLLTATDGRMTVQVPSQDALPWKNVNAAFYLQVLSETDDPAMVGVYTDLATALQEASDVHILGDVPVAADLVLQTRLLGATGTNVTVESGAVLTIGSIGGIPLFANVTAPEHTTLTVADGGLIRVVNGKLAVFGLTTDTYGDRVVAAVFLTAAPNGIYTDLATALDMAVAGDVLALRGTSGTDYADAAYILRDVELKAGVTLDLKQNSVVIGAFSNTGATPTVTRTGALTVNGQLTGGTEGSVIAVLAGSTLTVNTGDNGTAPGFDLRTGLYLSGERVALGGTLIIGKDAVLTATRVIVPNGELTVNGQLTSSAYFTLIGDTHLTVAGQMTLRSTNLTTDNGSAMTIDVSGVLRLAKNLYFSGVAGHITVAAGGQLLADSGESALGVHSAIFAPAAEVGEPSFIGNGTLVLDILGTVGATENGQLAVIADGITSHITVNVSGTLNAMIVQGNGDTFDLNIADGGRVSLGEADLAIDSYISTLTITGSGAQKMLGDGLLYIGKAFTAGTKPTGFAVAVNPAVADVILNSGAIGLVYGQASGVSVRAVNSVDAVAAGDATGNGGTITLGITKFWTVGANENYLYVTEYANIENGTTAVYGQPLVLTAITDFVGYRFVGWFDAAKDGNTVTGGTIGAISSVYGIFLPVYHTVTLNYVAGADYLVNNQVVGSGQQQYQYGTVLTITLVAQPGFDVSKATVSDGSRNTREITVTVTSDLQITASGVTEKQVPAGDGITVTDTLLIVLVLICGIVALAVVARLMKS